MVLVALHCKKSFAVFPSPSRDVTYQTLPGRESNNLIIPIQGEFLQCMLSAWPLWELDNLVVTSPSHIFTLRAP
jgi:hypothetical protein